MRYLLTILFISLSFWGQKASAQISDSLLTSQISRSYKQAIGIRSYVAGEADRSLNYSRFITGRTALEFNLGTIWTINDIFQANTVYSVNNGIFNSKGLKYKYGAGLGIMYASPKSYLVVMHDATKKTGKIFPGIIGLVGLDYQFKNSRFIMGADLRLHIYRVQSANRYIGNPGISLKYILKQ